MDFHVFLKLCENGSEQEIIDAINGGADVNARDNNGRTALMYASQGGRSEAVKELIEAGADVNAQNNNGETALMNALDWGNFEAVKVLIEAGADLNIQDEDGDTALMNALEDENFEVAKVLIEAGADVNARDKYGWSALMNALFRRNFEAVKVLIEAGADLNIQDEDGKTALMNALDWRNFEAVKVLIEAGADVNAQNNNGCTALMYASQGGRSEVVKALIEAGADVNARDNYGRTSLMLAARRGRSEAVKALIEAGLDVNNCDLTDSDAIEKLLEIGDGYEDSDKGKAVKFYTCAAAGKLDPYYEDVYSLKVRAMRRIAEIYDEAGDIEKAIEWYSKFSENEDGEICLYNSDKFYSIGEYRVRGIAERIAELYYEIGRKAQSVKYYNKLNFQHDDESYGYKVARISYEIAAECKDDTEAASWYRMAAENGNVEAMYALAEMYEEGRGVERDIDEAVKWYREASERGHLTAKTILDKTNNLSETVISEKEPETDTVEDDEDENAENEDNGIDMKQAMKAEAVERMKLLGLPEKIINEFQEKSVIYVSESVKYGEIRKVYRLDKNDILCIDIKEFEKEYRGSLVYHVIRDFNGENSYGDIDSFLNVFPEPLEWDYVKKVFKTKKILMDVYAFNRTIPEFSDYGEILVEAKDGGLLRMS